MDCLTDAQLIIFADTVGFEIVTLSDTLVLLTKDTGSFLWELVEKGVLCKVEGKNS